MRTKFTADETIQVLCWRNGKTTKQLQEAEADNVKLRGVVAEQNALIKSLRNTMQKMQQADTMVHGYSAIEQVTNMTLVADLAEHMVNTYRTDHARALFDAAREIHPKVVGDRLARLFPPLYVPQPLPGTPRPAEPSPVPAVTVDSSTWAERATPELRAYKDIDPTFKNFVELGWTDAAMVTAGFLRPKSSPPTAPKE